MPGPSKVRRFWDPVDISRDIQHVRGRQRREQRILRLLDGIGFSWRVYAVAFLGFLASSWSLIAVGIVSPALYFVYPPEGRLSHSGDVAQILDIVTLVATVCGMVIFGHLADRFGRSSLYGFELLIVLSAVGGAAFSSEGYMVARNQDSSVYSSSMDIYASLTWWRFALGFGLGAEYPMSAVIAAEFSSTAGRGSLLAAVFLAQAIGRVLAYGLGLGVLHGLQGTTMIPGLTSTEADRIMMDKLWRLVLGLAGIPAIFAIFLRLFIPETPRYYSAVERDLVKARAAVLKVGARSPSIGATGGAGFDAENAESINSDVLDDSDEARATRPSWGRRAYAYFFGPSKGWKPLVAISVQWLLLDIVFYGTGFDSPGTLAALWLEKNPGGDNAFFSAKYEGFGVWKDDYAYPNATITETMDRNLVRTLEISSIAAILGSLAILLLINRLSRRTHYILTTGALTVLFAATTVSVSQTYAKQSHWASVVFYAVTQFLFNLGPNTLTFILAAEAFPTEFRGTCYGLAAAAGKIGAIIVRPITEVAGKSQTNLVNLLAGFTGALALMTILAWWEPGGVALPRVQHRRGKMQGFGPELQNLSLEEIAPWPVKERAETESLEGSEEEMGHTHPHMHGGEEVEDGGFQGEVHGDIGRSDREVPRGLGVDHGERGAMPEFRLPEPHWAADARV
ncbi:major facilitator superfamily domain-containing protein [Chaetomium sp. MPI-SDFR-AT-0129]|nr:major facilitator superfamily domain-containing protein [Chaetomium sp. MPI-SDFR-AT-0129]